MTLDSAQHAASRSYTHRLIHMYTYNFCPRSLNSFLCVFIRLFVKKHSLNRQPFLITLVKHYSLTAPHTPGDFRSTNKISTGYTGCLFFVLQSPKSKIKEDRVGCHLAVYCVSMGYTVCLGEEGLQRSCCLRSGFNHQRNCP